jgi:hypothetical protein
MKALLTLLAMAAVMSVAVMATIRVGPLYATCPSSSNAVLANNDDVETEGSGVFTYTFDIQSWALNFNPTGVVVSYYPGTTANIVDPENYLDFIPNSIYVQGRGCEWNGGANPDVIAVEGTLLDPDMDGNVDNYVTIGAVGHSHSEPMDTFIPRR